ncbi:peptidoglycan editing factor PgeF [Thermodesulfobacteriota bacterium]
MILEHSNGVSFFQFPKLLVFSDIQHGIFTRNNGTSRGSYSSLNVSFGVGDDRRRVLQNRKIISQCLAGDDLVFIDQVHGTRVLIFAKENESGNPYSIDSLSEHEFTEIGEELGGVIESESGHPLIGDAIVTNMLNKNLVVQVADCQSVLMYEPVRQVVANVHAGWRGSINNIIGRTIKVMEQNFGCYPRDIVAGISPSLGPCCAEFINYRQEIPAAFWPYKDDRDHFDFWSVSRDQLCDAGVIDKNIDLGRICTKCDTDNFFSFRGQGTTGRFASVIGIKET